MRPAPPADKPSETFMSVLKVPCTMSTAAAPPMQVQCSAKLGPRLIVLFVLVFFGMIRRESERNFTSGF